ncbi:MAG: zf-HC2 domain-containing protein [Acidobacteriota bacterium]
MSPEQHISAERLAALAGGELPEAEREAALRHLEECAPCGDRLAAVLLLRRSHVSAPRRGGIALAAAALVLLAGAWMMLPRERAETPVAEAPVPQPLSPERRAVVDRFAAYAQDENIEAFVYDWLLDIAYPDVVPVSPDQHQPRTRAALEELRDGHYPQAIDQLADLYREYPDFDTIGGWLGVALYLNGETDPVVEALLEKGRESSLGPLADMSTWYGAQYLLRTHRPEEAVALLRLLAPRPIQLGRMAKAQLEEMPLEELDLHDAVGVPQT